MTKNDLKKSIETSKKLFDFNKISELSIEYYFDYENYGKLNFYCGLIEKYINKGKDVPVELVSEFMSCYDRAGNSKMLDKKKEEIFNRVKELTQKVIQRFNDTPYNFKSKLRKEYPFPSLDKKNKTSIEPFTMEISYSLNNIVFKIYDSILKEGINQLAYKNKESRDSIIKDIYNALLKYLTQGQIKLKKQKYILYVLSAYMAELLGFKVTQGENPNNEKYFFAGRYAIEHKKKNPVN